MYIAREHWALRISVGSTRCFTSNHRHRLIGYPVITQMIQIPPPGNVHEDVSYNGNECWVLSRVFQGPIETENEINEPLE